jgi:septum formation protein
MQIILASASRDRKKCLEAANIPAIIVPSAFDETSITETNPYQLVQILAQKKAETVQIQWKNGKIDRVPPTEQTLIIGADTMVIIDNEIIGKARSKQHAFDILSRMMGTTHEIITGVAILSSLYPEPCVFYISSKVHFQPLSPSQIKDYINITEEYKGRAGAYSMYERASLFIDSIEGSPTNVLGLPMAELRDQIWTKFRINLLNLA